MSFGTIGYRDGQRTDQKDATNLAWSRSGTFNANITSGALATQGFSHTLAYVNLTGGGLVLEADHLSDAAGAILLGSSVWAINSLIGNNWAIAIPNLGPYVQLSASVLSGKANYVGDLRAQLSNKERPSKGLLGLPFWAGSGASIVAGGTLTEYATIYHGGSIQALFIAGSQATTFTLQTQDTFGTWRNVYLTAPAALGNVNAGPILVPFAPVRLLIQNGSGAAADAGWQATIVPDLDGG